MPTITVGFDGSAGAEAALRFALDEAKLRHAELRLVHAWHPTPYTTGTWGIVPFPHSVETEITAKREQALTELRTHVAHAQRRAGAPDVHVEVVGLEGPAEDVLVEEARDADLLVLGTHGRSRVASLVLGSVSRACAQHATCPVIVVPAAWILELEPCEVAKTVVFSTPKGHVRAVVPADAQVWRTKLEELLDEDVWLSSEDELREAYPDFEPGATPPFGGAEDVVIVDTAVAERPSVVIEAARHDLSLRLPGNALVDVADAWVSDIQEPGRGS